MFVIKRSQENPLISQVRDHPWEASATFNMSPIKKGGHIYGLYRSISSKDSFRSPDQISTISLAKSVDGKHFEERSQFIIPEKDWDKFGCEDPRVTLFEGRY